MLHWLKRYVAFVASGKSISPTDKRDEHRENIELTSEAKGRSICPTPLRLEQYENIEETLVALGIERSP